MLSRMQFFAAAALLPLIVPASPAADLPRKAPELMINMNSGNPTQLSRYKGKVVAVCFILTTCPHCQRTVGLLTGLQNEFGPKGFQTIASAIDQGAAFAVPRFIAAFRPSFPVGFSDPSVAVDFMQHPPMMVPMMPMLAFVDRQGNVREQHEGDDSKFFNDQQEQNLRSRIEFYLNEAAGSHTTKAAPKKAGPAKKQS
jgi:thiol-disulfide isomerase/thioredoxin